MTAASPKKVKTPFSMVLISLKGKVFLWEGIVQGTHAYCIEANF